MKKVIFVAKDLSRYEATFNIFNFFLVRKCSMLRVRVSPQSPFFNINLSSIRYESVYANSERNFWRFFE